MKHITVQSFTLGMVATNCYLVTNTATMETIIFDPADDAKKLIMEIERKELKPVAILLTHGHFDHILAVDELRDHYHIPVYAHQDEEDILAQVSLNLSTMIGIQFTTHADVYVRDGEKLEIAGLQIVVLHTPGHTKGGVCYYIPEEKILMSGDTLFHCSIGRTDFPTGSMGTLVRSVKEKLFILPDDVKVYPGHDSETTIGYEKQYNPFMN